MTYYQVFFLPWYKVEKSITIGPVTLWSYEEADSRIKDKEIRQWLDRYFKAYVDNTGKPVGTITVCSTKDDFVSRDNDFHNIRDAINCLIFAAIIPQTLNGVGSDNNSLAPPTSDLFELVNQRFVPDNDYIAVSTGSVFSGGLKIGQVFFSRPWAIGSLLISIDGEILDGLNKCFYLDTSEDLRLRILRSLEWFRMAHIESQIDVLSRVVMMATAFEILLDIDNDKKARSFANKLERIIATESFTKEKRKLGREYEERTIAYWWAFFFYQLRNGIVHGDIIHNDQLIYRGWITQQIVADIVFWEFLFYELLGKRWIGSKVHEFSSRLSDCCSESSDEELSLKYITGLLYGFSNIHRALGWIKLS